MWEYRQPAAQHRGYGCPNNSKLTGNYAMLIQGWSDSSQGEVFTGLAASFVANGAGSITGELATLTTPQTAIRK